MNSSESSAGRMDRREAIKWMMTAVATTSLLEPAGLLGQGSTPGMPKPGSGYGTDPDLLKAYNPGDLWPLTFNDAQRATAAALCATIIPADEKGPSAATVKVQDFIDEWISAPYPEHAPDRRVIIDGLAWIDAEGQKRYRKNFAGLSETERNAICDDVCDSKNAKPAFKRGAEFFARFRDLTASGYYTTAEGMRDMGYVGNVALERYDGPPPEVLRKLGLA